MSELSMYFPVVSFGEILWNILPSGELAAGAPMNITYHLRSLGINPTLITRVGLDGQGKRLIELLESQDISTDFFQIDNELPTGKVHLNADGQNEINYEFQKPAAWDNISWDAGFEKLLEASRFFVFGSLPVRSAISSKTLFQLLEIAPFKVLNTNLHPPHFTRKSVEDILNRTDMLKLNISELELITGWFTRDYSDADRMQILQDKFHIQTIIVTRGSKGSVLNANGSLHEHPGFDVPFSDSQGSDDAFLAGMLYKMSHSASAEDSNEFANAMGALVALKPGGFPDYNAQEIEDIISKSKNLSIPRHK